MQICKISRNPDTTDIVEINSNPTTFETLKAIACIWGFLEKFDRDLEIIELDEFKLDPGQVSLIAVDVGGTFDTSEVSSIQINYKSQITNSPRVL